MCALSEESGKREKMYHGGCKIFGMDVMQGVQ